MPTFEPLTTGPRWRPVVYHGPTFRPIPLRPDRVAFTRYGLARHRQDFIHQLTNGWHRAINRLKTLTGWLARRGAVIALAGGLLLGGSLPAHAQGNVMTVTQSDGADLTDGNGCSLSEAIINANDDAATFSDCPAGNGADTIVLDALVSFAEPVTAPYDTMQTAAPQITSEITIQGGLNQIIERSAADDTPEFRFFRNQYGTLTLDDVILQNGDAGNANGGAVLNVGGTLTLQNGTAIQSNRAEKGGGVHNMLGGTVILEDVFIAENSANQGGGIYSSYALDENINTVEIRYSTIAYNSGGGIESVQSDLSIYDVVLYSNSTTGNGGGLIVNGGTVSIQETSIDRNTAEIGGGGIALSNLTDFYMRDTVIVENTAGQFGGGMYLYNAGGQIEQSYILNNTAELNGGGLHHIGLYYEATLTLNETAIEENIANYGGGIFTSRSLSLIRSTLTANSAELGGGGIRFYHYLPFFDVNLTLEESTLLGNTTDGNGGGIEIQSALGMETTGTVTVTQSLLQQNSAAYAGGAIRATTAASITLENSTVSGNMATTGGGISLSATTTIDLTLTHVTMSENSATENADTLDTVSSRLTVNSSLLGNPAGNASDDCALDDTTVAGDGLSLISATDATCADIPHQGTIDLDAHLLPLTDNGGPTRTHALRDEPDNPALDSGSDATAQLVENVDQRGETRLDPDIGAFERTLDDD
jgi:predicted outer membrane repeat protein